MWSSSCVCACAHETFAWMSTVWLEKITWFDMLSGWKDYTKEGKMKKMKHISKYTSIASVIRRWQNQRHPRPFSIVPNTLEPMFFFSRPSKATNIEHLLLVMKQQCRAKAIWKRERQRVWSRIKEMTRNRARETECRCQTIKYFHFIKMKRLNADNNHFDELSSSRIAKI